MKFRFHRSQPKPETKAEPYDNRDLGFGTFVSEASRKRLLNRNGTFNVRRTGMPFFGSLNLYHLLLNMRWVRFIGFIIFTYLALNVFFAVAYFLCGPDALQGNSGTVASPFWRAFFFSVETFATIGYGNLAPSTMPANLIMTVESLVGLLGFALATGILFARFSRPTAKVIFSRKAVIAPYREGAAFMFRLTNGRASQMVELKIKVIFTRFEGLDGKRIRKYYMLDLERRSVAFFPLAWTIVHPIDEASPLYGADWEQLEKDRAEFLVLLNGFDETFSQTVHTRTSYISDEIECEAKFTSMYNPMTVDADLSIDVRLLDNTTAAPLPVVEAESESSS